MDKQLSFKNELKKQGIDNLPTLGKEAVKIKDQILNFWADNQKYSYEIKMLKEQNTYKLQKLTMRYTLMRDTLMLVFGERNKALNGHYAALEKGLNSDDRELIIASLQGISNIVSQNPLESFDNFTKFLDAPEETLLLDF